MDEPCCGQHGGYPPYRRRSIGDRFCYDLDRRFSPQGPGPARVERYERYEEGYRSGWQRPEVRRPYYSYPVNHLPQYRGPPPRIWERPRTCEPPLPPYRHESVIMGPPFHSSPEEDQPCEPYVERSYTWRRLPRPPPPAICEEGIPFPEWYVDSYNLGIRCWHTKSVPTVDPF